jgi:hypothetical protein
MTLLLRRSAIILNRSRFPVADVAEDPLVKPELALLHTAADETGLRANAAVPTTRRVQTARR